MVDENKEIKIIQIEEIYKNKFNEEQVIVIEIIDITLSFGEKVKTVVFNKLEDDKINKTPYVRTYDNFLKEFMLWIL